MKKSDTQAQVVDSESDETEEDQEDQEETDSKHPFAPHPASSHPVFNKSQTTIMASQQRPATNQGQTAPASNNLLEPTSNPFRRQYMNACPSTAAEPAPPLQERLPAPQRPSAHDLPEPRVNPFLPRCLNKPALPLTDINQEVNIMSEFREEFRPKKLSADIEALGVDKQAPDNMKGLPSSQLSEILKDMEAASESDQRPPTTTTKKDQRQTMSFMQPDTTLQVFIQPADSHCD